MINSKDINCGCRGAPRILKGRHATTIKNVWWKNFFKSQKKLPVFTLKFGFANFFFPKTYWSSKEFFTLNLSLISRISGFQEGGHGTMPRLNTLLCGCIFQFLCLI